MVLVCSVAAWRLWMESPHLTIVGQVDVETALVTSPVAGNLILINDEKHHIYEPVAKDEVLTRIEQTGGKDAEVTSPIAGQIVKIHAGKGRHVAVGDPLFTIAAERGHHITTYVRADQRLQPEPGMPVDIRLRSDPSQIFQAAVERIGPQYEQIPIAQLRDQKSKEWGVPVVISIPTNAALKPGELVYIAWRSASTPTTSMQSLGLK